METIRAGNSTEAAVLSALVDRGLPVLVPFGEGHPYDLAIDFGGSGFVRVQCKTAWIDSGCAVFNSRSTDHGRGELDYCGRADVFGVRLQPEGTVYLFPVDAAPRSRVYLRLQPPRNNQRKGVRLAVNYELDRWSDRELASLAPIPRDAPGLAAVGS